MSRDPRGRVGQNKEPEPLQFPKPSKMVFGLHERCPTCRGTGKRPKRKELCGACGGHGVIERGTRDG